MPAPLKIELQASKWLSAYLIALLTLSYLAVIITGLPMMITASLIAVISLYSFILWRRYVTDFDQLMPSCIYYQDRQWFLDVAKEKVAVELHESLVWPFLAVAQYRSPLTQQCYKVLLMPDSCNKDGFRRLSILWRSGKAFSKG